MASPQPKKKKVTINFLATFARLGHLLAEGAERLACIRVCAYCANNYDKATETVFGDYSLCEQCKRPVTSKDKAFFVPRKLPSR